MPLTCPVCRLLSPPEARRCDCGYDFLTRRVERPYSATPACGRSASLLPLAVAGVLAGATAGGVLAVATNPGGDLHGYVLTFLRLPAGVAAGGLIGLLGAVAIFVVRSQAGLSRPSDRSRLR